MADEFRTMRISEELCRSVAPWDLEFLACYVVPAAIAPSELRPRSVDPGWAGYTGGSLDSRLQEFLQARCLWRGRGFATILDEERVRKHPPATFAGAVLHELAHHLADPLFGYRNQSSETAMHDARWARALCHLVGRAQLRNWPISLANCQATFDERFSEALSAEIRCFQGSRLRELLTMPAPEQFTDLCRNWRYDPGASAAIWGLSPSTWALL